MPEPFLHSVGCNSHNNYTKLWKEDTQLDFCKASIPLGQSGIKNSFRRILTNHVEVTL